MEETKNNLISMIKGVAIAYGITIVLILVFSGLLAFTGLSESTIPTGILIISLFSILLSSTLTMKRLKEKGLVNGGILGLVYVLIIYAFSSVFDTSFALNQYSILMIVIGIVAGVVGGIVGVNLSR